MSSFIGQQAVVIGAGIGGLTAARALADHYLSLGERSCCPAAGIGRNRSGLPR
jgi:flavin-dependent dehydrogenase